MNYWLTVHWPPYKGEEDSEGRIWVFIPKKHKQKGINIKKGDLIFVYETETGRKQKNRPGDRFIVGCQCIFALAKAKSKLKPHDKEPTEYEDGSEIWWAWKIETELVSYCNISRADVCSILDYSQNYYFMGFRCVKELTNKQFNDLKSKC